MIAFIVSWAVAPILFWIVMIGNNARHNMPTTLPIIAMIIIFLYDRAPKYITALTLLLILGNFYIVPPSFSILTPSGNLFESNKLLKERMLKFHSSAKEITEINEDKIVVLGYFHNPHVVFEIMRSAPFYEASKIGRENYRILAGGKEYVFIYFVAADPEDIVTGINSITNEALAKVSNCHPEPVEGYL